MGQSFVLYQGPLLFHINFRIISSVSTQHSGEILMGIALTLQIGVRRIDILTQLSLPGHEHSTALHLLRSFWISLGGQRFEPLVLLFPALCRSQKASSGVWPGLWKETNPGPLFQPMPQAPPYADQIRGRTFILKHGLSQEPCGRTGPARNWQPMWTRRLAKQPGDLPLVPAR